MNTIGQRIKFSSFGESHGEIIGGTLDGLPAGVEIDFETIKSFIDRRRPNVEQGGTKRAEKDEFRIVSGLFEGKTTGTPLTFIVENKNIRSNDYDQVKNWNRPSHADFVYRQKYKNYDYRGGGRASARETVVRVIAGAIASQILEKLKIVLWTFVSSIGKYKSTVNDLWPKENARVLFPDEGAKNNMLNLINSQQKNSDSVGGVVQCRIKGIAPGLGSPLYNKLNAALAHAMFSINAVKGVEIGQGFNSANMFGSDYNDQLNIVDGETVYQTNNDGGITAGLSNGNIIQFNVAFKPVASIGISQQTIDTSNKTKTIAITGRHDSCIVPRAAVVVESMAAIVLLDFLAQSKADHLGNYIENFKNR